MTPDEIIAGFEAGKPGTERIARLRRRVEALRGDGVWAAMLDGLCRLDGTGLAEFLGRVRPDPEPASRPRGFEGLLDVVEAMRDGALSCRIAPRPDLYETMPLRQAHENGVRLRLGLARGSWNEEAEALSRRLHEERERPLVLLPARLGEAVGPAQVVAALAANAALAVRRHERARDLEALRKAVFAAREGRAA